MVSYLNSFCFTFTLMKIATKILLLFFFVFLSAPTIVSLLEKEEDISCLYNLEEDEDEVAIKECKVTFKVDSVFELIVFESWKSNKIISENLSKYDSITSAIIVTPPEHL